MNPHATVGRNVFGRSPLCCIVLGLVLQGVVFGQGDGAQATSAFAALEIIPVGEQIFDITTGRTELPDGGEVVDNATGVRLVSPYIIFTTGEVIEANDVSVTGSFGSFSAAELVIDIPGATLAAIGDLLLERENLSLAAAELVYDAAAEIASFGGPVVGTSPDFEAAGLLLDTLNGTVLLFGPYRFQSGPVTLTSNRTEGRLELVFELVDSVASYRAATEVAPETLDRFTGHLP